MVVLDCILNCRLHLLFLVVHSKILKALSTSDYLTHLMPATFTVFSVYGLVFIYQYVITQYIINANNLFTSLGLVLHF